MNNVMIGFEREPTVKLLDFGACELQDRYYAFDQRYPAPPEARGRLGTGGLEKLEWSAPEVRAGEGWSARTGASVIELSEVSSSISVSLVISSSRPRRAFGSGLSAASSAASSSTLAPGRFSRRRTSLLRSLPLKGRRPVSRRYSRRPTE